MGRIIADGFVIKLLRPIGSSGAERKIIAVQFVINYGLFMLIIVINRGTFVPYFAAIVIDYWALLTSLLQFFARQYVIYVTNKSTILFWRITNLGLGESRYGLRHHEAAAVCG